MASPSTSVTEISPTVLVEALKGTVQTRRAAAIWGHPGIAKSAVLLELANSLGLAFIDIRLSQILPEDLRGMPYPATVGGIEGMTWNPPHILPRDLDYSFAVDLEAEMDTLVDFYNPRSTKNGIFYCVDPEVVVRTFNKEHHAVFAFDRDEDGSDRKNRIKVELRDARGEPVAGRVRIFVKGKSKALLALEEFNSGNPAVQASCYELLHDRMLGSYAVPDGVVIVATGNLEDDGGLTYELLKPVANRFMHYYMKLDAANWLPWARANDVHPLIVGYIEAFTGDLLDMNVSDDKAFATARSWEILSDHLNASPVASDELVRVWSYGSVGRKASTFLGFRKNFEGLSLSAADVLSGRVSKVTFPRTAEVIGMQYAFLMSLVGTLRREKDAWRAEYPTQERYRRSPAYKEWAKRCDNFGLFVEQSLNTDMQIMSWTHALSDAHLPLWQEDIPSFDRMLKGPNGTRVANIALTGSKPGKDRNRVI